MVVENVVLIGSICFYFDNYVVCVDGMVESGGVNFLCFSELYDWVNVINED